MDSQQPIAIAVHTPFWKDQASYGYRPAPAATSTPRSRPLHLHHVTKARPAQASTPQPWEAYHARASKRPRMTTPQSGLARRYHHHYWSDEDDEQDADLATREAYASSGLSVQDSASSSHTPGALTGDPILDLGSIRMTDSERRHLADEILSQKSASQPENPAWADMLDLDTLGSRGPEELESTMWNSLYAFVDCMYGGKDVPRRA